MHLVYAYFIQCRLQQLNEQLHTSTSLQRAQATVFMGRIGHAEWLCNAVTALVAPNLYEAGRQAIERVQLGQDMNRTHGNVALWPSVFTGMQIIANRTTPPHRDRGGAPTHYDLLLSAGTHVKAELCLPEFGTKLSYPPGTIVELCGKVFIHEVDDWEGGERVCVAHMMKDDVHDRLNVMRPSWPQKADYL
jgi:hypothetical protein